MSTSGFKPPWLAVLAGLAAGRAPGQAVIQTTQACNASCGHCGMSAANRFPRKSLSTEQIKALLEMFAGRGVMAVSLTGGEPMLFAEKTAECLDHARRLGIASRRTGTNGFFLADADDPDFRERVLRYAELLSRNGCTHFWISLDSADPQVHERFRGLPGVVEGMRRGLPIFHEHGLFPAANLCLNRRMGGDRIEEGLPAEEFFRRCRKALILYFGQALELGFTAANVCHPMIASEFGETDPVYAAISDAAVIRFHPRERAPLYRALYEAVVLFRPRLRIFTPLSALLPMIRQGEGLTPGGWPCLGGRDYFFADAAGQGVFPCGYRGGENLLERFENGAGPPPGQEPCARCDWECFRDPSQLFGPLLELFRHPFRLARRFWNDPLWARLWLGDLRYCRACSWFAGGPKKRPRRSRLVPASLPAGQEVSFS